MKSQEFECTFNNIPVPLPNLRTQEFDHSEHFPDPSRT